jgi:uncharacterized membrane protein
MYNEFMEAKVVSTGHQGMQPTVTVGFFDGKEEMHKKVYYLDPGQTIDDIKPQIKDDFDRVSQTVAEAKENRKRQGEKIDLKGVKSVSELRAEEEAKAKEEAEPFE